MQTEKGVILAVYKKVRRNNRYAILQRKKNWEGWELPKGHLEENDYQKTVKIELKEETGITKDQIQKITDLEETTSWTYEQDGKKYKKEYKAFLVEVDENTKIDTSENPCDEHVHGFFLKEKDTKGLLTHENNKEVLNKGVEKIQN